MKWQIAIEQDEKIKMTIGLLGKKCGMTRIFTEDGIAIPVTVIEVQPNHVTQIKTKDNDGYNAIQVSTGTAKRHRVTKPMAGHYAKAGVEPGTQMCEFTVDEDEGDSGKGGFGELKIGSELKTDIFNEGQFVDVKGVSKGKGFAGVIKRYHFAGQDRSHGNSLSHRAPGSIGQRQSPGKVFKGKKMCGHMGDDSCTILNQKIARIDAERNLIMISGAVPGGTNAFVVIRPAIKKHEQA